MTKTVAVKKDKLKGIFDTASLKLSEPTSTDTLERLSQEKSLISTQMMETSPLGS